MKTKIVKIIKLASLVVLAVFIWLLWFLVLALILGLILWAMLWLYEKTVYEFSFFILLLDILALWTFLKFLRSKTTREYIKGFWNHLKWNL